MSYVVVLPNYSGKGHAAEVGQTVTVCGVPLAKKAPNGLRWPVFMERDRYHCERCRRILLRQVST